MNAKRYIAIALLVLASAVSQAQYAEYYYHRNLDTIDGDSPTWFHQWWDWEEFRAEGKEATFLSGNSDYSCSLGYNYTPDSLKVVGVAIVAPCWYYQLATYHPSKLYVYEAEADTFYRKAEVEWDLVRDQVQYRNLIIHSNGWLTDPYPFTPGSGCHPVDAGDSCCNTCLWDAMVRVMEYYFDEPVYVADSFYVGPSMDFGQYNPDPVTGISIFSKGGHYSAGAEIPRPCKDNDPQCGFENTKYRWMNDDSTWFFPQGRTPYYELCWPIIQVDTTEPPEWECLPPENITVTPGGEGEAMVTWDGFGNYTMVRLRYGPVNMPPAQWTEVDVTGQNTYLLAGLNMAFPLYSMQLNASCDSLNRHSGWTEAVTFAPGTGVEGVETALSEAVRLSPNPTGGKVEVESGLLLWHIDLYNGRGLLVLSERLSGHRSVIDMEGLPGGIYFAAIRTSRGTTVKKIVKQ